MKLQHHTVFAGALVSAAALVLAPARASEVQKITPSDGAAQDAFGGSVAIQGDLLAVGAPFDDDLGTNSGSVYVFTRSAGVWTQAAKITAPDGVAHDEFGVSIALDGGRLLVGAFRSDGPTGTVDQGAAYVFTGSGASWSLQTKLVASDGTFADHLGTSVALDGDRALVGASNDDQNGFRTGSAYVFRFDGGTWTEETKLLPLDPHVADVFGSSVAIDGDRALVGATAAQNGNLSAPGSAYVFVRSGNNWSQEQKLTSSVAEEEGHFGQSVVLEGDRLVVGASGETQRGLVHVYSRGTNGIWSEDLFISPLGSVQYRRFGWSLALRGDVLAVGASNEEQPFLGAGAVFLYKTVNGSWFKDSRLSASDAQPEDHLGQSVALSGTDIVAGAWNDNTAGGVDAGSAYLFTAIPDGTFGHSFCFGDGTGTPCPCGNTSAVGAGQGCQNGSGEGADLDAWGSTSVAVDDLRIGLSHMNITVPGSVPGILAVGDNALNGGLGVPFGAGLRCLAAPTRRLGIVFATHPRTAVWGPGLRTLGLWNAGETKRFQVWHRANPASAPCGQPYNLSSALEITFTP